MGKYKCANVYFCNSLVHDVNVDEESPTSSKSDPDTDCDILGEGRPSAHVAIVEDKVVPPTARSSMPPWKGPGERRRRKLPEIPKNKKCKCNITHYMSKYYPIYTYQNIIIIMRTYMYL